jgi:VWFA-related protein
VSRTSVAAGIAALLLAAAGLGQEPPPRAAFVGERVEVEVIDVDVVVTDRAGRPVLGLERSDFELLVDGGPVPIDYFAAPPSGPAAMSFGVQADPARAAHGETPSWLAVFVDQAELGTRLRASALAELRGFLSRRAGGERVLLAAFEQRLHLLLAPTSDAEAIEASLDELARLPTTSELAASERRHLDTRIRGLGIGWVGGELSLALAQREADLLETEVRRWGEEELDRQRRSLDALGQLIGALAALDGRKSLVLVSGGTTTEGAESLLTLLSRERLGPNQRPPLFEEKQRTRDAFEAVIRVAQDSRVALYVVHPGDTTMLQGGAEVGRIGQQPTPLPRDPAIVDAAASAAQLAGSTGGRTYLLGANLDGRLGSVRADVRGVYSLGFAAGPAFGGGDHRIEVRLDRRDLRLRHRAGFRRQSAEERAEAAFHAAAMLGETHDPLGVSLSVLDDRAASKAGGDRLLAIEARVPLASLALLPEDGSRRGRLTTRIALLGERGELYTSPPRPMTIERTDADLERAPDAEWVHRAEVRVPPATRMLALLLVDEVAGVHATAVAAVSERR